MFRTTFNNFTRTQGITITARTLMGNRPTDNKHTDSKPTDNN
jgi:hypothetical protein